MKNRVGIEWTVGLFVLAGLFGLMALAFKVSGLTQLTAERGYFISATFDTVGDLKIRAPVSIAGVKVGQVTNIELDKKTYRGRVTLKIFNGLSLPKDTAASIFTEGLLGSNYVSLEPGFDDAHLLKNGDILVETHPAVILENLIGQMIFSSDKKDEEKK